MRVMEHRAKSNPAMMINRPQLLDGGAYSGAGLQDILLKGSRTIGKALCPPGYVGKVHDQEKPRHLPCHNFTGPGTDVWARINAGIKPMNPVDSGSQQHDITYDQVAKALKAGTMSKDKAKQVLRESDKELVRRVRANNVPKRDAFIVDKAISGKMKAEDLGIVDPLKYVKGSGKEKEPEKPNPLKNLRKKAIKIHKNKKQKGGKFPFNKLTKLALPNLLKTLF